MDKSILKTIKIPYRLPYYEVPQAQIDIQLNLSGIKKLLKEIYNYTEEEAEEYTKLIRKQIYDEAFKTTLPNGEYINNALSKRIESLQTGIDIGAKISKITYRLKKICNECEEHFNRIQKLKKSKEEIELKNTVEARNNPNYKMHVLGKYECLTCERSSILGRKEVDDLEEAVRCPYCGSYNMEGTVIMDDQDSLDELGCLGIGHLEYEEEKEKSSMAIIKKVYIYNVGGCDDRIIVSDKDLIHGTEDYNYEEATLIIKEETMKEWAEEQSLTEPDYDVIDDRY